MRVSLPIVYTPRRRGLGATGTLSGQACGAGILSNAQLQALAISAGFPASLAPQMAAIAQRESAGCPTAYNPGTALIPENSYGLWQINVLGNPGILDALGLSDPTQLFDPETNAAAAFYLYGGDPNNINVAWMATSGPPTSTLGLPDSSVTVPLPTLVMPTDLDSLEADLSGIDPTTAVIGAAVLGLVLAAVLG